MSLGARGQKPTQGANRQLHSRIIVYLVWLGLYTLVLTFHEPWRDELQQFNITRSIDSIGELLVVSNLEATPPGWFLWILLFAKYSSFEVFTIATATLMALAVGIFLIRANLGLGTLIGVVFSYFVLFEFGVVVRSYTMTVALLLVLFCLNIQRATLTLLAIRIALAISSVWGIYFSIATFFLIPGRIERKKEYLWHQSLVALVILLSTWSLVWNDERSWDGGKEGLFGSPERTGNSLFAAISRTAFPIVDFADPRWGESPVIGNLRPEVSGAIGAVVVIALFLRAALAGLFPGAAQVVAMGIFALHFAFLHTGSLRHWGMALVIMVWVALRFRPERAPTWVSTRTALQLFTSLVLSILAIGNILGAASISWADVSKPFSSASEIAIEIAVSPEIPIMAFPDWSAVTALGISGREAYLINDGRTSDYWVLTQDRQSPKTEVPPFCLDVPSPKSSFLITEQGTAKNIALTEGVTLVRVSSPALVEGNLYLFNVKNTCDPKVWAGIEDMVERSY